MTHCSRPFLGAVDAELEVSLLPFPRRRAHHTRPSSSSSAPPPLPPTSLCTNPARSTRSLSQQAPLERWILPHNTSRRPRQTPTRPSGTPSPSPQPRAFPRPRRSSSRQSAASPSTVPRSPCPLFQTSGTSVSRARRSFPGSSTLSSPSCLYVRAL